VLVDRSGPFLGSLQTLARTFASYRMVEPALFSLEAYTQQARDWIEAALAHYVAFDADCPARLRAAIEHSLLAPAKRLRPLLVLMSCEACGSSPHLAVPAACAIEMVHTYSLIHDDLPAMDDDDLRRGRPTCHAQFDEATAILAGDALLARAFELLATELPNPQVAAACCRDLARAAGACALVGGQMADLLGEASDGSLSQLEAIHRRKTGALIRTSVRLGGLVAEATPAQLTCLDSYGCALGLGFQIVDDLLDVRGDVQALGKRTGKDSARGKLTFPGLMGEEESERRARELIAKACDAVAPLGSAARGLVALAQFVVERTR
jgi:geranylgeranyl diphosphate synthase type II